MAAKALPVKIDPWPKTDRPWSRLHIDYVEPMKEIYYLIVVDSFMKWSKVVKCRRPTCKSTINFCAKFLQDLVFQIQFYLIMGRNLRLKNLEISTKNFQLAM